MTTFEVEEFEIATSESALEDLELRLARARVAPSLQGDGWRYGTSGAYLEELLSYWRETFDWRAQETALNGLPHRRVVLDDVPVHFIHVRGRGTRTIPLVLTHGWPWTFWDFRKVIGPLTDPAAYGGDSGDAFDVVVPSLPGFTFSSPLPREGVTFTTTADLWVRLMSEVLGYERFGAHGSDWGMFVTAQLGHKYPERMLGIHLAGTARLESWGATTEYHPWTDYLRGAEATTDPAARDDYLKWERNRASHLAVSMGDPQSLAHGLHDSPVALASWLINRRYAWGDCRGDIESRFSKDELLTNIALYWFTDTFWSSIRYYASAVDFPWQPSHTRIPRVEVPTGFTMFRPDRPPGFDLGRIDLSTTFNVASMRMHESGGHFGPAEEPETFVRDVRDFFRTFR